jgi:hypothetical protein
MANPQPTPFVRFSKELFEAFYMNPPENVAACQLWLWVLRWTWADFDKTETKERTLGQIALEVGISKPQVCKALQSLVRCRRLKMGQNGGYAIQKDYDLWCEDPKKREVHYGNQMRQEPLFQLVDNLGISRKIVSNGETLAVSNGEINRFTVGQSTVSPSETPIRIENTVENREKARTPQLLPNGKTDTPTARAELGHWEFAPQDHPGFTRLSFKLQDTLADQWRERAEEQRKRTACKKCATRPRAGAWPYCRPCTVCAKCDAVADGRLKFNVVDGAITCENCKEA